MKIPRAMMRTTAMKNKTTISKSVRRKREGSRPRVRDSQRETCIHTNSGYGTYLCSTLPLCFFRLVVLCVALVAFDLVFGQKCQEREVVRMMREMYANTTIDYSTYICLASSLCFVVIVLLAFLCGGRLALCVFYGQLTRGLVKNVRTGERGALLQAQVHAGGTIFLYCRLQYCRPQDL